MGMMAYGGAWSLRRGLIADIIKRNGFDIVASQELTKEQVLDFASLLGPEYAYAEERLKGLGEFDKSVLAGRKAPKNDKIELSMHNAIWYKPARFDVLDKGAFYLSATPDKFSFGFDKVDGQHRRCVWAKFLDKASGAEFFVFNVHTNSMDYPQDAERLKSARVIISQIEKIAGKDPFILCGDFNAFDTSESMRAYLSDGRFSDEISILLKQICERLDASTKALDRAAGRIVYLENFQPQGIPGEISDVTGRPKDRYTRGYYTSNPRAKLLAALAMIPDLPWEKCNV